MDWIYEDMIYRECIRLAQKSTGNERFGAVLVRDGFIAGEGYNRRPEKNDAIKMGMSNHAEIDALNDALRKHINTDVASIYVAGYFSDKDILNIPQSLSYTCTKCPKHLLKHKIINLFVPTIDGWERFTIPEALESARKFVANIQGENTYEKRFATGNSGVTLADFLQKRK